MDDTTAVRDALHEFLLDFIPLTDEIHEQNPTFADVVQRAALEALACEDGAGRRQRLATVGRLLSLACDLGYIDAEVLSYLERQLGRIRPGTGRS